MVVRQKKIKLDYDDFPVKSDGDTIKLEKEEEKFIDSPDVEGQPHDWRLTYDLLQAYRASHVAPVDTMGCTLLSPVGEVPENLKRFHILLGLLLSSQTKDQITHDAMFRLHNYCKPALVSPESLLMIDESKLADLLKPVGFFKKKATYIRLLSEKLVADYEGQVPTKFEKIMAFTGIGPKMVPIYISVT